jgi:hypothetical protein
MALLGAEKTAMMRRRVKAVLATKIGQEEPWYARRREEEDGDRNATSEILYHMSPPTRKREIFQTKDPPPTPCSSIGVVACFQCLENARNSTEMMFFLRGFGALSMLIYGTLRFAQIPVKGWLKFQGPIQMHFCGFIQL